MEKQIEIINAVKAFKDMIALDHVSLDFEKGQIHGIVGRNGSGKTVLLKCICGFLELTSGEIKVQGKKISPHQPQNMGIIIETPGFIGTKSGLKNLEYLASIRGTISKERCVEVMHEVGLNPEERKSVRKYSLGMRQRLGIAQALMENPPLLLLDEPMNGLDNAGVEDVRNILKKLRDQGKTILLASHSHEDISSLCDTVVELDQGRVVSRSMYVNEDVLVKQRE